MPLFGERLGQSADHLSLMLCFDQWFRLYFADRWYVAARGVGVHGAGRRCCTVPAGTDAGYARASGFTLLNAGRPS